MTDIDELERLIKSSKQPAQPVSGATALALIAEVRALRNRLEIDDCHPHDGIYCRDETIKGLERKVDELQRDAELYRYMLAVARANGFHSITEAITPRKEMTREHRAALIQAIDVMGANGYHWVSETLNGLIHVTEPQ